MRAHNVNNVFLYIFLLNFNRLQLKEWMVDVDFGFVVNDELPTIFNGTNEAPDMNNEWNNKLE